MKKGILLCLLILGVYHLQAQQYFHMRPGIKSDEYIANTIVFKIKPQYRSRCSGNAISVPKLNSVLQTLNTVKIGKAFPQAQAVSNERNATGQPLVDLSLIYEIQYNNAYKLEKAINNLLKTGMLVYAEPRYTAKPFYHPSDTSAVDTLQYYLSTIHAYEAWDITKGDTTVIIGITDTGTDPRHPDLKGNMVPGWNFLGNNNDASDDSTGYPHGTSVCGVAAAVTDNITGVAGVGFKCRFMPIKMDFSNPYQSLIYAADHGCAVINCSWGHIDYSAAGEDAVNYATVNKNALVVGAAGNSGNFEIYYPSGYINAMGVGSTAQADQKSPFSDYNYTIDIMAPGSNIYTTIYYGKYGYEAGTSFSAPIVSAGAALIKSYFPAYSALQLREQLRVTSDIIDTMGVNAPYKNKMGHGRINLYKALTISSPSVRWINRVITDKNDNVFNINDTLRFSGDFKKFLATPNNLTITLSCADPNVTILNGTLNVGNLSTMAVSNNNANPFLVKINSGMPYDTKLSFKLTYTGTGYTDEEWVEVLVNPDFVNLTVNDIATTITSKGRLGYNGYLTEGLGFVYKNNGEQLISEMSLMVGVPRRPVSDGLSGIYVLPDDNFMRQVATKKVIPSVKSDMDLDGTYNDGLTDTNAMQVQVHQKVYAWASIGDRNYYIIQYTISNKSNRIYDSLFAGIYADWNIATVANRTNVDTALKLGYTYDPSGVYTYTGVKLMTGQGFHSYGAEPYVPGAVSLANFGGDDVVKYTMLSTNRYKAGYSFANDVAQVVSSGPYHLVPNDSITIAFIVMAADNLSELKQTASRAVSKYNGIAQVVQQPEQGSFAFPNPTSNVIDLYFPAHNVGSATVKIYNTAGQLISERAVQQGLQQINISTADWAPGIYIYQITTATANYQGKFVVVK